MSKILPLVGAQISCKGMKIHWMWCKSTVRKKAVVWCCELSRIDPPLHRDIKGIILYLRSDSFGFFGVVTIVRFHTIERLELLLDHSMIHFSAIFRGLASLWNNLQA